MNNQNINVEELYSQSPDRLYVSRDRNTWYACYDSQLCILTNAGSDYMRAFCYENKSDFREIRNMIVEEYGLLRERVVSFDDEYN